MNSIAQFAEQFLPAPGMRDQIAAEVLYQLTGPTPIGDAILVSAFGVGIVAIARLIFGRGW